MAAAFEFIQSYHNHFAYVAIFVFLSLSFSRLILELRKNVVLAYFNQGVAQLFFLGLYI